MTHYTTRCKKTNNAIATGPNEWCVCESAEKCRLHPSEPDSELPQVAGGSGANYK